ncbi:hypothetical protein GCM10010411_74350 [Actinomadura fulvescens]|uniref:Uncharacterized protein n=1 Tax=Actinomadura fulvescens TaxID=46160 RepID=A0ABP6CW49_9ACTN
MVTGPQEVKKAMTRTAYSRSVTGAIAWCGVWANAYGPPPRLRTTTLRTTMSTGSDVQTQNGALRPIASNQLACPVASLSASHDGLKRLGVRVRRVVGLRWEHHLVPA